MDNLIIKNFGPIIEVNIDLKQYMILIGPQSSGKSLIAKLITTLKSIKFLAGTKSFEDYSEHFLFNNYLDNDSYILYKTDKYHFEYLNKTSKLTFLAEDLKVHIENLSAPGGIREQLDKANKSRDDIDSRLKELQGQITAFEIDSKKGQRGDTIVAEEIANFKARLELILREVEQRNQATVNAEVSDANLKLSDLYEKAGNTGESYKYYKNHIAYRDSINNVNSVQKMADLRTDYEVSQKQVEVDLLHQQKKNQQIIVAATIIALLLICVLAIVLYRAINLSGRLTRSLRKKGNALKHCSSIFSPKKPPKNSSKTARCRPRGLNPSPCCLRISKGLPSMQKSYHRKNW